MSWRPDAEPGRGGARGALALIFLSAWAAGGAPTAAATPATTAPAAGAPAPKPAHAAGSDVIARVNGSPVLRRDFDLLVQVQFRQRGPGQRRHEDLDAVR